MNDYNKKQPASIQSMFDSIALDYDRTNAVLSLGMHYYWNKALIKHAVLPFAPTSLVDLCAGTGEIAFGSAKSVPSLEKIELIDFSGHMLACAKRKAVASHLKKSLFTFTQADVHALPHAENSIDCMTMAYGIRNVKNRGECLREVYRALKPGGSFGILELTEPTNRLLKKAHRLYLKAALPALGKLLTSNQNAYNYLSGSIHAFIKPADLKAELQEAGFISPLVKPLVMGVATLFLARKSQ